MNVIRIAPMSSSGIAVRSSMFQKTVKTVAITAVTKKSLFLIIEGISLCCGQQRKGDTCGYERKCDKEHGELIIHLCAPEKTECTNNDAHCRDDVVDHVLQIILRGA